MSKIENILMSLLEDDQFIKRFCYGCPERYIISRTAYDGIEESCPADFCIDDEDCVRNDRWQRIVDAVEAATADCPEEAI